jgi:hypothetical protein
VQVFQKLEKKTQTTTCSYIRCMNGSQRLLYNFLHFYILAVYSVILIAGLQLWYAVCDIYMLPSSSLSFFPFLCVERAYGPVCIPSLHSFLHFLWTRDMKTSSRHRLSYMSLKEQVWARLVQLHERLHEQLHNFNSQTASSLSSLSENSLSHS